MKKILIFIFFVISTVTLSGQSNLIGIKGGINWTDVSYYSGMKGDVGYVTNSVACISSGLTYDYIDNGNFIWGVELLYEQRRYTGIANIISPVYPPPSPIYLSDHYVYYAIPLKVCYILGETFFGFGNIGIAPAFLKSAIDEHTTTDSIGNKTSTDYNLKNSNSNFELSGLIEIGCGYKLLKNFEIITSFRLQDSFTSTNKYGSHHWTERDLCFGIKYILPTKAKASN